MTELNDYQRMSKWVGSDLLEMAGRKLVEEGFFSMSLESRLAFIQGLKFGVGLSASSPSEKVRAELFTAMIAQAGMNLHKTTN